MKLFRADVSFRTFFLWGLLGFVIAAVLFAFVYNEVKSPTHSSLARLGIVPDMTLVERSGEKVPLSDLKGKAWIADFIFTNCGGSCPIMSSLMANLQERMKGVENIRLISFSVDPERDTPDVLREYAEMYHATPSRWLFLTGEKGKVARLAREGFHLGVTPDSSSSTEPIIHSTLFVLVDKQGIIRGYYDSNEEPAMDKLAADALSLASEKN